jgi:hypothetical protein
MHGASGKWCGNEATPVLAYRPWDDDRSVRARRQLKPLHLSLHTPIKGAEGIAFEEISIDQDRGLSTLDPSKR